MPNIAGSVALSGNNTLLAAPPVPQQIFIVGWSLFGASAVNAYFADGAGNTFMAPMAMPLSLAGANLGEDQTGASPGIILAANASMRAGFACAPGQALLLNLSGAVSVTYSIDYYIA